MTRFNLPGKKSAVFGREAFVDAHRRCLTGNVRLWSASYARGREQCRLQVVLSATTVLVHDLRGRRNVRRSMMLRLCRISSQN